jgi:hypothetical protein
MLPEHAAYSEILNSTVFMLTGNNMMAALWETGRDRCGPVKSA